MGFNIEVKVEGLNEFYRVINNLRYFDDDISSFMNSELIPILTQQTKKDFDNESFGGMPWPPLSPATKRGEQMLVQSGEMRAAALDPDNYEIQGTALVITGNALSKVLSKRKRGGGYPYWFVQNFGDERGHVPDRPFIGISQETEMLIYQKLLDYFEKNNIIESGQRSNVYGVLTQYLDLG